MSNSKSKCSNSNRTWVKNKSLKNRTKVKRTIKFKQSKNNLNNSHSKLSTNSWLLRWSPSWKSRPSTKRVKDKRKSICSSSQVAVRRSTRAWMSYRYRTDRQTLSMSRFNRQCPGHSLLGLIPHLPAAKEQRCRFVKITLASITFLRMVKEQARVDLSNFLINKCPSRAHLFICSSKIPKQWASQIQWHSRNKPLTSCRAAQ